VSRAPSAFRQRDVTRAIRGVVASGLAVAGVKIDPQTGKIEVVTGKLEEQNPSSLDKWMAKHAHEA
jgi:hypothetical protein